jgi:hypothetical protein
MIQMNLVGKDYRHNDFVGKVVAFVDKGSFKGCYEVHVTNEVTGEKCIWWFRKAILENQYK